MTSATIRPAEGKVIGWIIYDIETDEACIFCKSRAEARDLAGGYEGCVICAVRVSH